MTAMEIDYESRRGRCLFYAAFAALEDGVEVWVGYAKCLPDGYPLEHAWNVLPDGTVSDPTWREGYEYRGHPVDAEFALAYSTKVTTDPSALIVEDAVVPCGM